MSTSIPSELVIVIYLPLLKKSSDVSIDVTENSLFLISETPAKYKLSLDLLYIVDDCQGHAKFDTVERTLTVTLPVQKNKSCAVITDFNREDSGVESDNFTGNSNSSSGSDDDGSLEKEIKKSQDDGNEITADSGNSIGLDVQSINGSTQRVLKPNIHYSLPNYKCHLFGNVLNTTLQVSNVNPESVEYCFIDKSNLSGFCLSFQSTGSGFFPVNYAFYLLLPSPSKIDKDTFNVEIWDNNVIAQIKLSSDDKSTNRPNICYIGSDENCLENISLVITDMGDARLENEEALENKSKGNELGIEENGEKEEKKEDLLEDGTDVSMPETRTTSEQDSSVGTKRSALKCRTVSESNQSDSRLSRGILKIGRSLSMSNVDDYASWSADKEKTKKTVRFSEVITKQTFRMNSSILGQRKKNQRKLKNKRRAQEKRLSESGNESEGDNEMTMMKGKDQFNCNRDVDIWYQDADSSSCETSEISEVSDVSESDDGLKEDPKAYVPCSSKRNHKRRGKKSARKNAATAKFQFLDN